MTIHSSHPFADPVQVAARQLRGRLGNRVTLWCAGTLGTASSSGADAGNLAGGRATPASGLTVSSALVVPGEPWRIVGFVDPMSDLAEAIALTGRATITFLQHHHRALADMFGGVAPAPGGAFRHASFRQTDHGPLLADASTWAALELERTSDVGWMRQLTCRVSAAHAGADPEPLHHVRGRYATLE